MPVCYPIHRIERVLIDYVLAIILGDYLYIDGGMVAFRHNDSTLDYQPGTFPNGNELLFGAMS